MGNIKENIGKWIMTNKLFIIIPSAIILLLLIAGIINWNNGSRGKILIYIAIVIFLICSYFPIFYINELDNYKKLFPNNTDAIYIFILIIIGLIYFLILSKLFAKFFDENLPNYYCFTIYSLLIVLIMIFWGLSLSNIDLREHKWVVPTFIISIILIIISPVVFNFRNEILIFLKSINWNDIFLNKDNIYDFLTNLIMVVIIILIILSIDKF